MDSNKFDQIIKLNNEIEKIQCRIVDINNKTLENEMEMEKHLVAVNPHSYKYDNGKRNMYELRDEAQKKCSNCQNDNYRIIEDLQNKIYNYKQMIEKII